MCLIQLRIRGSGDERSSKHIQARHSLSFSRVNLWSENDRFDHYDIRKTLGESRKEASNSK